MIDVLDVFILAPLQYDDVVIDGGSEIDHQSHIFRLTGVAILGVIDFSSGHIVRQKQRAVVPLSPITGHPWPSGTDRISADLHRLDPLSILGFCKDILLHSNSVVPG